MNEEIKEILDDYKQLAGQITMKLDNTAEYENWLIIQEYFDWLLDYITNLQQENEDNLKCIKSLKEQLESAINENQKLLEKWFNQNNDIVKLTSDKEYYIDNLKDYKSRVDKAIEYIKELYDNTDDTTCYDIDRNAKNDLLNILQGADKE